jgi:peptidyl-prolyl cis-trans isomerase D
MGSMLSLMRRHAKSWLIKVLIGIIAIVFVFYFGYSFRARQASKIASVNGDVITIAQYDKAYRNLLEGLQREYRGMWNDNLIKLFGLKNRALDGLITQKLISQEAERIGLDVTKKEIQEKILSYPAFQFNGRFDESRYRSVLLNNQMTPEDFEEVLEQELLQEKLQQFLTTFSPVTDEEILDQYTYANKKVKVSFVQFKADGYKDKVKVDEASLVKYFDENKEKYRTPEKIKVAYIVLDPNAFKPQVKVTDEQIKDYYDEHIDTFSEKKQVEARHILFKLAENATKEEDEKVKEKAEEVLKKAKAGEDFAELAKKYSEGPTAKDGGELGYFSENQMVKPFEEAAFKLKKGEISDLVRTPFGYHIIKVEDVKEARTKSLEEVKEQIVAKITKTATSDLAYEKAMTLLDQMPYDADIKQYAAENQMKAEETDFFSLAESIPSVGGDEKLRQTLFSMEKNQTSEVIEQGGKFYIFQVKERQPSVIPALAEVKEKVKTDYTAYLAGEEAKAAAESYLQKLKGGEDWSKLAKETHHEAKTTEFFTRQESVKEVGYSPEFYQIAFSLNADRRYPDKVFQNDQGVFVIRWDGEEGINKAKYEEEKQQYRDVLRRTKDQALFREWLESLRKKAEIEIKRSFDQG